MHTAHTSCTLHASEPLTSGQHFSRPPAELTRPYCVVQVPAYPLDPVPGKRIATNCDWSISHCNYANSCRQQSFHHGLRREHSVTDVATRASCPVLAQQECLAPAPSRRPSVHAWRPASLRTTNHQSRLVHPPLDNTMSDPTDRKRT